MNLFKKLFNWNRKERNEELLEVIKRLNALEQKLEEKVIVKNRIKIGSNTIVVLSDGKTFTCDDPNNEFYHFCEKAINIKAIEIFYNSFNKEEEEDKIIEDDLLILRNNPDFIIKNEKVYLVGIDIPIPDAIVAEIIVNREKIEASNKEEFDDYYNRIILFWAKLSNSPVKYRDYIMTYCINNDIRLSPTGNLIAYRKVVEWENEVKGVVNTELQDFVNEEYYKIVKKWKKKASDYNVYNVYNDNSYLLVHKDRQNHGYNNYVGNLANLKNEPSKKENVQLYTSQHDKGKYRFTIPGLYKINKEEVDVNAGNCHSGGLHAASVNFNYSGYGDTAVVVLINPAKCIFVTPNSENKKFRVSEMYIACINPNSQDVHIDEKLIEEADRVYNDMTIEELKRSSLKELSIDESHKPETSEIDVKNIVEILKNRTITI
jgi:hypothetical protein